MRKSCENDISQTDYLTFRGWYHTLCHGPYNGTCHLGHGYPVDVLRCRICPASEVEVSLQHRLVGLSVPSWYVQWSENFYLRLAC
jgi:hypothetical protein